MPGRLHLVSGGQVDPEPPFVVPAKGRVVVGRGSGADLVLFDREVSREHFCVRHDGLEYFLDDLNSVNGTLVNGQPVEHSVNLKEGDTIQAGSISLRFTTREPEPEEQAEAPARPDQEEAEAGEAQVVHVPLRPVEGAAPGPPPRPVLAFRWWKLPLYPLLIPLALLLLPVQAVRTARWYRAAAAAHPDHTVRAFLQKHPKDTANKVFTWYQKVWYTAILLGLFVLFNYHALHFLHVFHALCTLYLIVILYKLVAVFLSVVHPGEIAVSPQEVAALGDEDLPVYTILVPLYREREVADKVIRHLGALDYPQEKLDVKLLLEPDDEETLEVCRRTRLPANYEIIVVPESVPKTKPKACNHGLERARGDYLVIYDAEDRPEPDQLKKAILAFRKANAPRTGLARLVRRTDTVCLQAKLNYFNPRQNLLTRWFTIEYSTWFDLFLPGLHHLGSPIPLGGTSNHFKTEVLQHIGGWDPYNVTEDCDLGIRLHKMGYSTRILDSTTWEEANSRVWNWVRQRSRWVKGYIQTHLVHMRNPFKTFWKLGPAGLFGFLSSVGGLSLMLLLNPIFWVIVLFYFACWAHDLSLVNWSWEAARELQRGYDPLQMRWPWERWLTWEGPWVWRMWFDDPEGNPFWNRWSQVFFVMTAVLFFANFLFVLMHLWACLRRRLYGLIPHALLTPFYWVLISLGAWKGLLQLFFKPFKWEKTHHGLDAGGGAP